MFNYGIFYQLIDGLGVFFGDALPAVCIGLCASLKQSGLTHLSAEVEMLFIPKQRLTGDGSRFSFSCYAYPRKNYEERLKSKIVDLDDFCFVDRGVSFIFSFDVFGGVCWLYIEKGEEVYLGIRKFMTE
jgi:hypothetical protein